MKKYFIITEIIIAGLAILAFSHANYLLGVLSSCVFVIMLYSYTLIEKDNPKTHYTTKKSRRKAYFDSLNPAEKEAYNRKALADYERKHYKSKTSK
jgi:hypothetical protein